MNDLEAKRRAAYQAFFEARDYRRAIELATPVLDANLASKQERLLVLISMMRLGRSDRARASFDDIRDTLENNPYGPFELWLWKLILGDATLDEVLRVTTDAQQRCQAYYYEGAKQLTDFEEEKARHAFRMCIQLDAGCAEVQLSRWALEFMEM